MYVESAFGGIYNVPPPLAFSHAPYSPARYSLVLRKNPIRVLFLFASFAVLSACQEAGPASQPPPAVDVVVMEHQSVTLTRELPGRTNAFVVAEVRPQVSGIIQERLFTEGSVVRSEEHTSELQSRG